MSGLRLSEHALDDLRAIAEKIEMVRPMLHHANALVPILAPRVGTATLALHLVEHY